VHPNCFNLERLRRELRPFRLLWFPRLRSTNDHAAALRKRGELFAPAVVLAGNQFAGRGRNTNTWWSGPGSITVTFVMPIDQQLLPHQLPLIAGLAVRSAVAQVTGEDNEIHLKWPNDLLYRCRKLAGLLCERVHKADLVGLGLNVNEARGVPPSLRGRIAWLSEAAGRMLDKTDVLVALSRQLHPTLTRRAEQPFVSALREYDRHHALIGRRVTVIGGPSEAVPSVTGACQGLDTNGRLLLRTRGGRVHRIIAGQVEMI
jgi:BirA family biotin operon repressor/biotin-[acetyl-CoA-carboxylase] ligase